MKILRFILFAMFSCQIALAQVITGTATDKTTGEPLPFATVQIRNTTTGTVTNRYGEFRIIIPDSLAPNGLEVSYMGYNTVFIANPITGIQYSVPMEQSLTELAEVVVRPLKPEEYIKIAVKKIRENYPSTPFASIAYYREKVIENGAFVELHEGIFESYYPSYLSKSANQHKLALYRTSDDLKDITFMKARMEKKEAKEKRKAEKKGKDIEEIENKQAVATDFGGPEDILESDLVKTLEDCLDSTQFKKFKYEFGPETTYLGREMMVINFKSKGKVDMIRQSGTIYIDIRSDAIAALTSDGVMVIPDAIKPILLAFGLGIKNPSLKKSIYYQVNNGKWYPKTIQRDISVALTEIRLLKSNLKSIFDIEQVFTINQLYFNELSEMDKEKVYSTKKPMKDQIYNDKGIRWDDMSFLKAEKMQ